MDSNSIFIYNDASSLNDLMMGNRKFVANERYVFGEILGNNPTYCNVYGVFSEETDIFGGGTYDYYTSVSIDLEQYIIIRLVCSGEGWVSMK